MGITAKRPLVWAAASYLLGILAGSWLDLPAKWLWVAAGLVLVLVLFLHRFPRSVWLLLVAFLLSGAAAISHSYDYSWVPLDKPVRLEGRIAEAEDRDKGRMYQLSHVSIDGVEIPQGVFLRSYERNFEVDDLVSLETRLSLPEPPAYPHAFDDQKYCASQNVAFRAYEGETWEVTGRSQDWLAALNGVRSWMGERMDELFGEQAGLAKALLIGEEGDISEESLENFRDAGISHILSVSGLHVSILVGCFALLLEKLRLNRRVTFVVTMVFLLAYVCLTGFRLSMVRAGVMTAIALAGRLTGRRPDYLSLLAAAFFVVVLPNPAVVFDVGVQLSYGAVFAILCLGPPLSRLLPGKFRTVNQSVSASLAVNAGTLPIIVNLNNYFWPLTIVVNILAVMLSSIAVPAAAVATLLYCLIGGVMAWLGQAVSVLLSGLESLSSLVDLLPEAGVTLPSLPTWIALVVFLVLFFASDFWRVRWKPKAATLGIGALFLIGAFLLPPLFAPSFQMVFLDVGQADAVALETRLGQTVLVDAGKDSYAATYLVKQGRRADKVVLTGVDQSHAGGLDALLSEGLVDEIYLPAEQKEFLGSKYPNVEMQALYDGDVVYLDAHSSLEVIYPPDTEEGTLALLLRYDGKEACLFLGDFTIEEEERLAEGETKAPVIRLGRNAAKTGTSAVFIDAVSPKYAVASTNREISDTVQEALDGVQVLSTKKDGCITFRWDGELKWEESR